MVTLDELVKNLKRGARSEDEAKLWEGYVTAIAEYLQVEPQSLLLRFSLAGEQIPVLQQKLFAYDRGARHTRIPRSKMKTYSVFEAEGPVGKFGIRLSTSKTLSDEQLGVLTSAFNRDDDLHYKSFIDYRRTLVDNLTHLPNEKGYANFLSHLQHAEQDGPVSGLLFAGDLSMLHEINKLGGTRGGNRVLQQCARQLLDYSKRTQGDWYLSRLHGDEFAWVYLGKTGNDAASIVSDIKSQLAYHPVTTPRLDDPAEFVELPVSLSIGWMPFKVGVRPLSEIQNEAESFIEQHKDSERAALYAKYPELEPYARKI